jgi:formylglycine-generating enzyme required for sulfatase activity
LPDDDICLPTGAADGCPAPATSLCVADSGAVDMSGNLKEWTSTETSLTPPAYRVRGGAFDNIAPGLTCQYNFISATPDYSFSNLGFRCCKTGP